MIDIGPALKLAREERGWSSRSLASRAGISHNTTRTLEAGKGTVAALEKALFALSIELDPIGKQLGVGIKQSRLSSGLTRTQVAQRAKIGLSALRRLESGRGQVISLVAVANALNLSLTFRKVTTWFGQPSTTHDWDTPNSVVKAVHRVIPEFDLDPSASTTSEIVAKTRYFSDGLSKPWFGKVWLNPPYAELGRWVQKASASIIGGNCSLVIGLIPARTDTAYFQNLVLGVADIIFLPSRLRFGKASGTARFSTVLAVWSHEEPDVVARLLHYTQGRLVASCAVVREVRLT